MTVIDEAQSALTRQEQRQALQLALESVIFRRNPRLSGLLRYLCERAEDAAAEPPKEFSIATDVFGRSVRFDSSTDSIVRVEMYRLRRKLREYYQSEGETATLQIVLQAGDYRPQYVAVGPPQAYNTAGKLALVPSMALPLIPGSSQVPRHPRRTKAIVWAIASAAVVTALVVYWSARPASKSPAIISAAIRAADARDSVRILCGLITGSVPESLSNWGPDRFFSGGTATATPVESIYRTRHPEFYRSARTGEFTYDIPLHPGPHQLKLYFADTSQGARSRVEGGENTRVFNVFANGTLLLQGFDIAADAGLDTSDIRIFKDVEPAEDGKLHLSFVHVADASLINAIEITPAPYAAAYPPVRLVTQAAAITTPDGRHWSSDDYFLEGRTLVRPVGTPVAADAHGLAADPLYSGERYGSFSYAVPMPQGKYTASLYFSEYFWGPVAPGGGGAGSRVFDVYCNGQTLWKNLDVFREAGGARRGLMKTAAGLEPNAQGKIVFSFVPVKNYAMVSAIELTDERSAGVSSNR